MLLSLVFVWAFFLSSSGMAASSRLELENITAAVWGDSIPPLVKNRMETTVAAIAAQLLAGKPVDMTPAEINNYEEIIHTVFDKVLVGYTVTGVECSLDENFPACRVKVGLAAWDDTIESISVKVNIEGMPPFIEELVRRDLTGVESVFSEAVVGLPVAASDWTNGLIKRSLNEYFAAHLPEFRADFDIFPERKSPVCLTVYPRLPVVRSLDLSMRSDTLPNFYLLNFRESYRDEVEIIMGVPVDFVKRHEAEITAHFARCLDEKSGLRELKANTKVSLAGGEKIQVMSRTNADRFHIRLIGWADIGRKSKSHPDDRDIMARLHLGYLPTKRNEFFGELDGYPQDASIAGAIGYRYALDSQKKLWGELKYDLSKLHMAYGLSYAFDWHWQLRYEYRRAGRMSEGAILYRLHDFLGVEFALDREDKWFRVIGYF